MGGVAFTGLHPEIVCNLTWAQVDHDLFGAAKELVDQIEKRPKVVQGECPTRREHIEFLQSERVRTGKPLLSDDEANDHYDRFYREWHEGE